jgi:hypothetical protein
MAVRGTKSNPLSPEPFGVYAWMMVITMCAMGITIFMICKELNEFYNWNSDELWSVCQWMFHTD